MSERFYDNKGIEHYGVFAKQNAENANRRYLREEKEAREQTLEFQRQQTEATERAARQAEIQRREQAEAEEKRLSEIKRQGRTAQRDRDYEKSVLFLKESDESPRLDTFIELIRSKVDWDLYPSEDDIWESERKKTIALFYQLPPIPQECKPYGTLTKNILTFVNFRQRPAEELLTAEELKLKSRLASVQQKLKDLETQDKSLSGKVGNLFSTAKAKARYKEILSLNQAEYDLNSELKPLLGQAHFRAQDEWKEPLNKNVDLWMAAVRNAALKSFFDQGLWIQDEFTNHLKTALIEIQKPFPTSCRANSENLTINQIQCAYKILVAAVADEIVSLMWRWDNLAQTPLMQSLCPEFGDRNDVLSKRYDQYKQATAMLTSKGVLVGLEEDQGIQKLNKKLISTILMDGPSALNALHSVALEEIPMKVDAQVNLQGPTYALTLLSVPASNKIAVIQAIRVVNPNIGLSEAKKLTETLPSKVLEGVSETVAGAAKQQLEQTGAGIKLDCISI